MRLVPLSEDQALALASRLLEMQATDGWGLLQLALRGYSEGVRSALVDFRLPDGTPDAIALQLAYERGKLAGLDQIRQALDMARDAAAQIRDPDYQSTGEPVLKWFAED